MAAKDQESRRQPSAIDDDDLKVLVEVNQQVKQNKLDGIKSIISKYLEFIQKNQ